jgi:hypothetical protein
MQLIIYVKDENFNKNHLLFTKTKKLFPRFATKNTIITFLKQSPLHKQTKTHFKKIKKIQTFPNTNKIYINGSDNSNQVNRKTTKIINWNTSNYKKEKKVGFYIQLGFLFFLAETAAGESSLPPPPELVASPIMVLCFFNLTKQSLNVKIKYQLIY